MRFLIDANLPRAVIVVVQTLGHHAEFARDAVQLPRVISGMLLSEVQSRLSPSWFWCE